MTATIAPFHPFLATDGQDFNPFPAMTECTVTQAAKILDGTELYVNELLDDKRLAFRSENGKRLIQWDSLLKFAQKRQRGRELLDEMVVWTKKWGYMIRGHC